MFKFKTLFLPLFTILVSLFFAAPVLAGGQLVDLSADTNGWVSGAGFGRTMWLYLKPDYPCKGTEITFKFIDPKEGDYVMTGSGTATFVMQEDRQVSYRNGVAGTTCGTYAKMISKVAGQRQITAEVKNNGSIWPNTGVITVDFDGKYHPDNAYEHYNYITNAAYNEWYPTVKDYVPTIIPHQVSLPAGKINLRLLSQEPVTSDGRQVTIKFGWSEVSTDLNGDVRYNIYAKQPGEKTWQQLLWDEGGPSATINLRADVDYTLKVQGCVKQISSCANSDELFLAKMKEPERKPGNNSVWPTQPVTNIIATPANVGSDTAQLQQKVENLQKQLQESQKRQASLEQTVNNLIKWIKSFFPFFK